MRSEITLDRHQFRDVISEYQRFVHDKTGRAKLGDYLNITCEEPEIYPGWEMYCRITGVTDIAAFRTNEMARIASIEIISSRRSRYEY